MVVHRMGMLVFLIILGGAAWQDMKTRSVGCRFLLISGYLGSIYSIIDGRSILDVTLSCGIGVILLGICKVTKGAIGEGDGWFFVISGLFLGVQENFVLLVSGLLGCFLVSLPMAVTAILKKKRNRIQGLPFLLFLVPGGVWLAAEYMKQGVVSWK